MKNIYNFAFYSGSREEVLPDFSDDFPYIATRAELDGFAGRYVPWQGNMEAGLRKNILRLWSPCGRSSRFLFFRKIW